MLTSCFENYIGVKCLTQTTPKSGLWINDLEGINLRFAADVADSGYISGLQLLEEKIRFATELVLAEISGFTSPYFRINSILDELLVGEYLTGFTTPDAFDKGVKFTTRNSRMIRIKVNRIKIKIQETNFAHSVKITDGINATIFPFTTDGNGEAEIFPDFLSKGSEIYVVMDNTAINPAVTNVKQGCSCFSKSSQYLVANGWSGSGVSTSSFGLEIQANAECSINELACVISQQLRFPILYKSGLEIVKEAAASDRLNSVTLLDDEKIQFLLNEFSEQYKLHFQNVVQTLPELLKRIDDICVICNQSRWIYGTP